MQTQIIASDLAVHKEQLGNKAYYFSQTDEKELMFLLEGYLSKTIVKKEVFEDYEERITIFNKTFLKIF